MVNPLIQQMKVYPMDRKRVLFSTLSRPITADLTIGEPQHDPDPKVLSILAEYASEGVRRYPRTKQESFLTEAIIDANLASKKLSPTIHEDQVLAGCGSGELLYSIAGASIDPSRPYVLIPNPAYQVYRIATEFAGGIPYFFNLTEQNNFQPDLESIPKEVLEKTSLCYINNPNNPCAVSYSRETLMNAVTLARRYNFVLASDECYGEIYSDEKPLSVLEICAEIDGDNSFRGVLCFDTLSKRSSLPGLRSGSMVGDAQLVQSYLKLRLTERKVLPLHVQRASAYAWRNVEDVANNRSLYAAKLSSMSSILHSFNWKHLPTTTTFYGWLNIRDVTEDDEQFSLKLAQATGVLTFPGNYFSSVHAGINPGAGFIRIALIDTIQNTKMALTELAQFYSYERGKK